LKRTKVSLYEQVEELLNKQLKNKFSFNHIAVIKLKEHSHVETEIRELFDVEQHN